MHVDFGRTAADYGRHRAGFPSELLERLHTIGVVHAGQQVIDVGTGTGTLARLFASTGCKVVGVDPAVPLLAEAITLDRAAGVEVAYVVGRAEHLPFPASSVDVYAAGQCWHWFDRPSAAAEARRVLRPNGRLVICHFDWLPLPGNVVSATEDLIRRHNPSWDMGGSTGIHPAWTIDVAQAGFRDIETFSFDVTVTYSHKAWRGRVRASAGVGGSLPQGAVARFDHDLERLLAERFHDPVQIPHRVWALLARSVGH